MNFLKKISIYSLVIGIGLGIIISSIFNIVYIQLKGSNIREEEPIFENSSIKFDSPKEGQEHGSEFLGDPNENQSELSDPIHKSVKNEDHHEIFIDRGMNSEEIAKLLEEKGIIKSKEEFNALAAKLKLTRNFKYGLKTIPPNSSLEEIMIILTKS